MLANRRRFPRVAIGARCWCETEGITLYARALNLSEGGLFIRTYAPLRKGSPAQVRFPVEPCGKEVAAQAVVVWVREPVERDDEMSPGMGLEFVSIDEESRTLIRNYVGRIQAGSAA